jgi:hypothetical protein
LSFSAYAPRRFANKTHSQFEVKKSPSLYSLT